MCAKKSLQRYKGTSGTWWNRSADEVEHRMDQLAERISDVQQAGAIDHMLQLRHANLQTTDEVHGHFRRR